MASRVLGPKRPERADLENRHKAGHLEPLGAGDRYAPLAQWRYSAKTRAWTWEQRQVDRLLTFEGGRSALRRHRRQWHRLLRAGMHGALAEYLSYGRGRWKRKLEALRLDRRLPALPADVVRNFPALLKIELTDVERAAIARLPTSSAPVLRPSIANVVALPALLESLVFMQFGFVPLWCEHGKHWYLSDDRRRVDCRDHRFAGQKARARTPAAYAKELRRRRERRKELVAELHALDQRYFHFKKSGGGWSPWHRHRRDELRNLLQIGERQKARP